MASLYSVSKEPIASNSSAEKGRRSRSCLTERMAFCDCHRQSFHCFSGTSRQSGWRLGLPGGSSSSIPKMEGATERGSYPDRSSDSFIVQDASKKLRYQVPINLVSNDSPKLS